VIAPSRPPVQLCLELRTRAPGRRASTPVAPRPYWDDVALADIGGELRAQTAAVRVAIDATKRADSSWVGSYDLLLRSDGTSGTTKPQASRQDALVSAAYRVIEYCESILDRKVGHIASDRRAASQVIRWLRLLDLL
jgi:hypothetical protein